MHEGKTADAEKAFRAAVAASPRMPDAYMALGLALLREGKPEDAAAALHKVIELNPAAQGVYLFLGIAEYQQNHMDGARAALKKEIAQNPRNTEALTWLGIVELAAGNSEAAVAPLDEAAKLAPNDMDVLDYRARAHSLVAYDSYSRMRQIDPDSWHIHRALAQAAAEMGNSQEAIKEYQSAIAKQPQNADLYESVGAEYQKTSQFDKAIDSYRSELQLSPNNPVALYNLGRIYVEQKNPADGIAYLEKAVPLLQHPAPGFYYLGLGLAKVGRDSEAVTALQKSLDSAPSGFIKRGAYFQLVQLYKRMNRPDDAARALAELQKVKAGETDTPRDHP